jgi:hypothetical protein
LTVSQRIEVRKQAGQEYTLAVIQELRGEALRVKYDDETDQWTLLRLLRVPSAPERL